MIRKFMPFLSGVILLLFLTSCPTPLDQEALNNAKDEIAPVITILSPADDSYCAKSVVVSGRVTDASTTDNADGKVSALEYAVLSSTVTGDAGLNDDGTFSFSFPTTSLGSNFVLRLTAEDWNRNIGEAVLNLQKIDGNDIPSFSVATGSRSVSLSWDEVPNTSSYTLYYTTDGSTPSENYGESVSGITSPYTLTGLNNGLMHVFQLRAHASAAGDQDSRSGYLQTIPLAPETLYPSVIPENGRLTVCWPEIPATDEFEVWRSKEENGIYIQINNRLTENEFVDRQVPDSGGYFYRIKPTLDGCPLSAAGYGSPSAFPSAAEIVESVDSIGLTYGLAVSGDYLFIAEGAKGLRIMDISDPDSPTEEVTVPLGEADGQYAFRVEVWDGYAYVANGREGLQIIDIDPLSSASVVRQVEKDHSAESAKDIALDTVNGYAYLTDSFFGLQIIDISTPSTAALYKEVSISGAKAVSLYDHYAFIATGTPGIEVVDLIDPAAPSSAAVVSVPALNPTYVNDIAAEDGLLHVASSSATDDYGIWDISTPTSPVELKTIDIPLTLDYAQGVTVGGGYAYVSTENAGVQVINTGINRTEGLFPAVVKTTIGTSNARGSVLDGDYLYVADSVGVKIVRIPDPSRAVTAASGTYTGNAKEIEVRGDYAYIADSSEGLVVMDISNPQSPSTAKTVSMPGNAGCIILHGNYAFVSDDSPAVQVVDITTLGDAARLGTIPAGATPTCLKISEGILYAGIGSSGVQIFDISDPLSPVDIKTVGTDAQVRDIAITGDYLFAADYTAGVKIIDIGVPADARVTHSFFDGVSTTHSGSVSSVTIHDRYLFVGAALVSPESPPFIRSSLFVYDISDPEAVEDAQYAYPVKLLSGFNDLHISGNYAYLSAGGTIYGLQTIDISDLTKAGFINLVETTGSIYDSFVVDDYLFCAAGTAGLQVIDLTPW